MHQKTGTQKEKNSKDSKLKNILQLSENFPPGSIGEIATVPVPDVDCGRTDMPNILAVAVAIHNKLVIHMEHTISCSLETSL